MPTAKLVPIYPGEVLLENFQAPPRVSHQRLAHDISVPPRRINEVVHGTRSVTADVALRLASHFGTTEYFWLNLQSRSDLELQRDRLAARLEQTVLVLAAAG